MKDKRIHERNPKSLQMTVKLPQGDARTLATGNVGDGGIFLLAARGECLPVGTDIVITPLQTIGGTSPPPSIKGRVVHVTDEGMGIAFLETNFT
ncbi:MAG: hypothetical protein NUV51_07105 [Sulfuricaulis sp.]|nr:hypothetical protein [Sulfuricaulis sp.]